MVRPPQPPVYMFVIDVSASAVSGGMLHVAAKTIKNCLDLLPGEERTMVRVASSPTQLYSGRDGDKVRGVDLSMILLLLLCPY